MHISLNVSWGFSIANLNNVTFIRCLTKKKGKEQSPAQKNSLFKAYVKVYGELTLSVGEVEEQTLDEQQRQQQRGSGSVHGGTAWHQHALAASVALAHRAL